MKNLRILTTIILLASIAFKTQAQQLPVLGVLNIKSTGIVYDNEQTGDLLRLEMEKLNKYEVLQREDAKIVLARAGLTFDSCYSKEALINVGKLMKAEFMLSGYVTRFSEKIVIRLMIINVNGGYVEKSNVMEYLNIQAELQTMIKLSVMKLLGEPINESQLTALTIKSFENHINTPGVSKLVLSGPRIGFVVLTGEDAKRLTAPADQGGFALNRSFMTVFGFQKEIQYVNEGNFQALFEFIPLVSGLDQGRFVPSFTFLNGFRNNKSGWEFALGPQVSITQTAKGFYDTQNNWHLEADYSNPLVPKLPNTQMIYALDKRGDPSLQYSFVFAGGKSIRSGSMNMPLNFYVAISKKDYRVGFMFGFNSKTNSTKEIL